MKNEEVDKSACRVVYYRHDGCTHYTVRKDSAHHQLGILVDGAFFRKRERDLLLKC